MKGIYRNILASCLIGIILFSGCSVTKHLPEGEVLYTGGKTVVENKSATPVGETALTEIDAALDKTPSTKMLGGLLPIPFKMWMYNDFVKGRNAHHKGALPFRQHENVRHLAYMPERFSHNPCKLKCYSQGIKNE